MKATTRLGDSFRNMRFKNKLILITSTSVTIVGVVAICSFQYILSQFNLLLYDQTAHSLNLITSSIATELGSAVELSKSLAISKVLQDDLYTYNTTPGGFQKSTALKNINQLFYRSVADHVIQLSIITPDGRTLGWGSDSSQEHPAVIAQMEQLCDEYMGAHLWLSSERPDGSVLLCRQIRRVEGFSLENLGYLVIRIDLGRVVTAATTTEEKFNYNFVVTIYDDDGGIIYPHLADSVPTAMMTDYASSPYIIKNLGGQRIFLVNTSLSEKVPGWSVTLGLPYNEIFQSVLVSNTLYLLFILVTIALLILVSSILMKNITIHFNEMVMKMERLKAGNFELVPTAGQRSNDELGLLNRYFDEMTTEFKKTIEDNYVKELLIAQAQLKSLEQQVNPHFLYNTLQSINWLAKKNGENNIVIMVEALANLLRNSLDSAEDMITIGQELSIVHSYLQIQQIRFGDALETVFEVGQDVLDLKIPKMTLQPLVENGIVHSLEEMVDICHLTVRIRSEDSCIIISVENNGSEIDTDIIAHLKNSSVKPRGNGIGLCNIDSRFKLIFGDEYGLSFENTSEGVIATAIMPDHRKEDSKC